MTRTEVVTARSRLAFVASFGSTKLVNCDDDAAAAAASTAVTRGFRAGSCYLAASGEGAVGKEAGPAINSEGVGSKRATPTRFSEESYSDAIHMVVTMICGTLKAAVADRERAAIL